MQIQFFNHLKKEYEVDEDKKRYYNLYTVAFGTGIRLGELLGLKWQDFNIEERTLTISKSIIRVTEIGENGKGRSVIKELLPKTVKSNSTIPLCDKVYDALINQKSLIEKSKELLTPINMYNNFDLIFPTKTGNYTDPRDLTRSFKSLLRRA
jgi:integrase